MAAAMADMTPPAGAADFLAAHGWAGATIEPLAGDASFRRYFRIRRGAERAVLMDAPPPHEDPRPFLSVAAWLAERRFAAPAIHAADLEQGLVLLEDFGDVRMRESADVDPAAALPLYEAAIDLLVELRRHPAADLRPYDRAELHREAALFVDWYCPAVGVAPDVEGYRAAWDQVLDRALADTPVTVLRDYHAENLMLLGPISVRAERSRSTRPGASTSLSVNGTGDEPRLGLLDFQDALAGHPAYDLVSLLQDARRDVEPAIEAAMLARYRAATGEGWAFLDAYHVLGAQRNAKILGIFTRLWKRDGKPHYAALCPRVWGYLERDLGHPALAPVARWFDAAVPPERRGDPLVLAA